MSRINTVLGVAWVLCAIALFYLTFQNTAPDPTESTAETEKAEVKKEPAKASEADEKKAAGPAAYEPPPTLNSNARLRTNQAGIEIIKESESLQLESYQSGGAWYIGYGHKGSDLGPGSKISESKAEQYLRGDLKIAEDAIKKALRVPVNSNEFSAMVSLAYNIGTGAFVHSSVMTELNLDNRQAAADAFLLWDKARVNGRLEEVPHLTERRKKERALFLK